MNKFKKIYHIISIVLALILAVTLEIWSMVGVPIYTAVFNGDRLVKEDYQVLKEYADIYVKTLNSEDINDDNVEITREIINDSIVITVNETRGGIKATFPIEIKPSANEGEFIMNISYKEGEYEEYSNIKSIFYYIFEILLVVTVVAFVIYGIIYFPIICIVTIINWIIVKVKKKKI